MRQPHDYRRHLQKLPHRRSRPPTTRRTNQPAATTTNIHLRTPVSRTVGHERQQQEEPTNPQQRRRTFIHSFIRSSPDGRTLFRSSALSFRQVLVHGYAAGNGFWMFVLKELSKHFRVACVEMYGCGRSERLPFNAKSPAETVRQRGGLFGPGSARRPVDSFRGSARAQQKCTRKAAGGRADVSENILRKSPGREREHETLAATAAAIIALGKNKLAGRVEFLENFLNKSWTRGRNTKLPPLDAISAGIQPAFFPAAVN